MLIKRKKNWELSENETTAHHYYVTRRSFIRGAGAIAGGLVLAACRPERPQVGGVTTEPHTPSADSEAVGNLPPVSTTTDELGDPLNAYEDVTGYNNFYEFTTNKRDVAPMAKDFVTTPWQVEVGGLVRNPGVYDLDTLRTKFDQEERIYRMRCVEAWSMVIPWIGFPLHKLLTEVEPTEKAKYVAFESLLDTDQFPGQRPGLFNPYEWPYTEGLRLDEAMNDLAILATGVYGEYLPPQNGAPIRLVVPWKYGLKGIKSIVRINLVEEQPKTLWNTANPREYGFYGNVNPEVDHPRWTQASERRIGEGGRRPTLMFNGYEEQVAALYAGMDLQVNY